MPRRHSTQIDYPHTTHYHTRYPTTIHRQAMIMRPRYWKERPRRVRRSLWCYKDAGIVQCFAHSDDACIEEAWLRLSADRDRASCERDSASQPISGSVPSQTVEVEVDNGANKVVLNLDSSGGIDVKVREGERWARTNQRRKYARTHACTHVRALTRTVSVSEESNVGIY